MKKAFYILMTMLLVTLLTYLGVFMLARTSATVVPLDCALLYIPILNSLCLMPSWVAYVVPLVGVVGGYFLGQLWWRIVYIEHRHWRTMIR